MWSARAHEAKKVCFGVKHTFTNGEEYKGWSPMTPKCTPNLGVACESHECSKPWLERKVSTKLGP